MLWLLSKAGTWAGTWVFHLMTTLLRDQDCGPNFGRKSRIISAKVVVTGKSITDILSECKSQVCGYHNGNWTSILVDMEKANTVNHLKLPDLVLGKLKDLFSCFPM